jgi:2-amino-4-hydroxy-6-hydroxymethyldihydropteridine diphosphokinase
MLDLSSSGYPPPYTHQAAVALGSNLGDSYAILAAAIKTLAHAPGMALQAQSPVYRTVAVGPPQPDYLNACALFATKLDPHAVLTTLLQTEVHFGRVRRERWGPRLLDLDLLLFDDLILNQPNLQIPHPRMTERAFVLVPLNDIAPNWIEPISKKTIAQLVQQVDCSGVNRYTS